GRWIKSVAECSIPALKGTSEEGEIDSEKEDKVECLWIKVKGKVNRVDIIVGVCYGPPSQDEQADEAFYKQLAEVS
ncbi:hypothetical protein HGM15179_019555, partial [Zosterops borbonicus]